MFSPFSGGAAASGYGQEEQGDRRVSVYYTSGQGESSQVIDLNHIDLINSNLNSHRKADNLHLSLKSPKPQQMVGHSGSQSGRVLSSPRPPALAGMMSPIQRVPNDDYVYADQEVSNVIRMCEENPER